MKSKKELYNSIMESVSTQVKKVLNEGGGAGYTVTLAGLTADNVHISKDEKDGDPIIRFSADILPGIVEWSADGYYDSVSSKGICDSNGNLLLDYDNEDKQVNGGTVRGYFYAEDVDDYGDDYDSEDSDQMYKDHIDNILFDGFEIEKMVGAGWIHADLSNPLILENIDVNINSNYNDYFHIDEISIECENIVNDINWFFAHRDEFEYDLDDEEDLNESLNEEKELSQSEKMDLWHEGKRDQNLKACGADKLRKNLTICKAKGYDAEAAAIEAEIKSRGLKESAINEGEITSDLEAKYGKPFADLVAGVLAQERDIDPEKDGDIMFNELVPGSGNADNLGGELLRAAERIAYRYWNDGDKAGEGYGRETVNPAVRFMEARVERQDGCNLCDLVDEIYDFVNRGYCNLVDNDYEILTWNILRETILYIILKQAWNIPNKEDMWDFKDDKQDVDRDDWDDEDW